MTALDTPLPQSTVPVALCTASEREQQARQLLTPAQCQERPENLPMRFTEVGLQFGYLPENYRELPVAERWAAFFACGAAFGFAQCEVHAILFGSPSLDQILWLAACQHSPAASKQLLKRGMS